MILKYNIMPESFHSWTDMFQMLQGECAEGILTGYAYEKDDKKYLHIIDPDFLKARVLEEVLESTQNILTQTYGANY